MSTDLHDRVREVLAQHARLSKDVSTLGPNDDLAAAGMTSHASVTVMLACEDEWDIEFPQSMLTKSTFSSITSISAAVAALGAVSTS